MKTKSLSIKVSPAIGTVSAELIAGQKNKCIMVLAHGAGAGMHHSFMETLAQLLAGVNIATLRFNFPFTENKKRKTGQPRSGTSNHRSSNFKSAEIISETSSFCCGQIFWRKNDLSIYGHESQRPSKGDHLLWISVTCSGQTFN